MILCVVCITSKACGDQHLDFLMVQGTEGSHASSVLSLGCDFRQKHFDFSFVT